MVPSDDATGPWEPAPAKLNLYLHVGPPEADGRHPLDSLVVFADYGDRLRVSHGHAGAPRSGGEEAGREHSMAVSGRFAEGLSVGEDNLVLRAASALRAAAAARGRDITVPVHLHLEKNLPVASGIGGGSADAAAALRALNRFWGLGFSLTDLAQVAGMLGADVPACIANTTAHMTGTGEQLAPACAPELFAVLANALAPVPTGPVYRRFDQLNGFAPPGGAVPAATFHAAPPPDAETPAGFIAALGSFRNDLEAAAIAIEPAIEACLGALRRLPEVRLVRMSGSGGTCFALFETRTGAQQAAQMLAQQEPAWWTLSCRLGDGACRLGDGG